MPELPEVETIARNLAPQLIGRTIVTIEKLDWERMVETPDLATFSSELAGRRILAVGRRAKWLLISLDANWTLALHLRMSGNLTLYPATVVPDQYTHLVLGLENGERLFFHDQRKFGRVRLLDPAGLADLDRAHGPEPLSAEFTPARLATVVAGRRTPIKVLLLDQQRIAGIGNIYASEALWIAGIHPLRAAGSLTEAEVIRLHAALREVLVQAIHNSGSTLRNYRNGYGQNGQQQEYFMVYDRAGQACTRCGTPIERVVVAQRSTFFCTVCQPTASPCLSPD